MICSISEFTISKYIRTYEQVIMSSNDLMSKEAYTDTDAGEAILHIVADWRFLTGENDG